MLMAVDYTGRGSRDDEVDQNLYKQLQLFMITFYVFIFYAS